LCETAHDVGSDLLNIHELPSGKICFVITTYTKLNANAQAFV